MTLDARFYNLVMQVKIEGLFEGGSISKICFYSNKSWSIFKKYWDLIHFAPALFHQICIQSPNTIPEACPK